MKKRETAQDHSKRLVLNRETLKLLEDEEELFKVAGGHSISSCGFAHQKPLCDV